jgi:hypothetical protein
MTPIHRHLNHPTLQQASSERRWGFSNGILMGCIREDSPEYAGVRNAKRCVYPLIGGREGNRGYGNPRFTLTLFVSSTLSSGV